MAAYRALYRKYRPQLFSDVVGQEAIVTALTSQITSGRVGHAYLFTGTRGTGKTTCAKLFAKAVNCENRQSADPCGVCGCCTGLENGSILDVVEIDAASNSGVDNIRDLRDETAYRPSHCAYKVYIIDEVHMLSTAAFNALLKIMEEPPSHVIFILATTEIHKIPATILSRCQRYDFLRIQPEDIARRLLDVAQQEEIALDASAADLIARLADGALRDALSLLDTCAATGQPVNEDLVRKMAGVADKGYLFALSGAIAAGDLQGMLALVLSLRDKSIDVKRLTEELTYHYRNFTLLAAQPDGGLLASLPPQERALYTEKNGEVGEVFSLFAVRRLATALDKMGRSADPRIELELALFDLCLPEGAAAPLPAAPPRQNAPKTESFAGPQQAAKTVAEEEIPAKPSGQSFAPQQTPPEDVGTQPPVAAAADSADGLDMPAPASAKDGENMPIFVQWQQVVEAMAPRDKMLHLYMKAATAYLDGRRVLIDGGDVFLTYMRSYPTAADSIKAVIAEITGESYSIGPYASDTGTATQQAQTQPMSATPVEKVADALGELEKKGLVVEWE